MFISPPNKGPSQSSEKMTNYTKEYNNSGKVGRIKILISLFLWNTTKEQTSGDEIRTDRSAAASCNL
jgi:hypothetical protein